MNEEEAIDILKNCIADYVIGDYCTGNYCAMEDECVENDMMECVFQQAIDTVLSELEKKEAIINEMAEQLAGLAIFDIEKDEPLVLGDKEEVKEYFTKKSEKEGIKE